MQTSARSVLLCGALFTALGCEGVIDDGSLNAPANGSVSAGGPVGSVGTGGAANAASSAATGTGGAANGTGGAANGTGGTTRGTGGAANGAGGAVTVTGGTGGAIGTGGAPRGTGGAANGTGGTASGTGGATQGTGGAVTATGGTGGVTGTGGASSTATVWRPSPGTTWQWQLTGAIDISVEAQMFDVDLFDVSAATVSALHARGRKVICYVSAGSFEDWRPDAAQFPAAVKGKALDGWPGEAWLDVRRIDLLAPVIEARLDLCRSKGFDGIEFDNVDGYSNSSGFPLTAADQLRYNQYLAGAAHARGLSVGLKNDLDQVGDLVSAFDWAINEECFAFSECGLLHPFIAAGKAVFNTEYQMTAAQVCPQAKSMGLSTLIKNLNLDAARQACL